MKTTGSILLLSIVYTSLSAQYYFTGEVKDLHGDKLQHVSIMVRSTGLTYKTGAYGNFEIISGKTEDSLTFSVDGYESYSTGISSNEFLRVTMKELSLPPSSNNNGRISVINDAGGAWRPSPETSALRTALVENPFVGQPATVSFACGGNGISYSNIKRFLAMGRTVPAEAVKVEEMLNYLNFYYEDPEAGNQFHCSSTLLSCPWNIDHRLLCLNICAGKADIHTAPPANLVFVIDVSGSMDMPDKLPLVKSGLHLLIKNLRDIDTVSFVEYGGRGRVLEGIPGSAKGQMIRAIEQLNADGPSPGEIGIKLAYQVAQRQFIPGGNNRIVLVTDGDISTVPAAARDLAGFVSGQYEERIHLSCLGVGLHKEDASELSLLAKAGHGNFACIADAQQAGKLLLNELAKGLAGFADKVCVTAGFDTSLVKEYRLLGFENKRSVLEDTTFRLEGTNLSSADALLSLFELVPKRDSAEIEHIAGISIGYCMPGQQKMRTMNYNCPNGRPIPFERAQVPLKKAVCIAMFAMKLKGSDYAAQISWEDIEKMTKKTFSARNSMDKDFINSVTKARKIYQHAQ